MTKDAGDSLDVGAIVKEVDGTGVAGAVPTDVLVDAGTLHPPFNGLAAAFVGREIEDEGFLLSCPMPTPTQKAKPWIFRKTPAKAFS